MVGALGPPERGGGVTLRQRERSRDSLSFTRAPQPPGGAQDKYPTHPVVPRLGQEEDGPSVLYFRLQPHF